MADAFKRLLGEKLQGQGADEVSTESICGEGKVVGLYFSAHWCPPCRGFTPKLAEFYKKHHLEKKFEIVFVSSDKNESEWKSYFNEMPWIALPFADRDRKEKLSKKFKVDGIPTLVILDGKDGKVIVANGRTKVAEDQQAKDFPWRPKGLADVMKDVKLVNHEKEEKSFADLTGKVLGLYFSAHWCPPCRAFTPQLIETYKKVKEKGNAFEIIFVSSDRSEEGYSDYFKEMPWLSTGFQEGIKKDLTQMYGVQGIPTLILFDEKHKIISSNGRHVVSADPEGEQFPWKLKPLNVINQLTVSTVNDEKCLIYFTDGKEASIQGAKDIIQPVAEHYFKVAEEADDDPPLFFFYTKRDDTSSSLRDFIGLNEEDDGTSAGILVILDIPSQMVYECQEEVLTKEVVEAFVNDFVNDKLSGERLPLR